MGEFAAKFRPDIDLDEFERRLRAAAPGPQSRPEQSPTGARSARRARASGRRRRPRPRPFRGFVPRPGGDRRHPSRAGQPRARRCRRRTSPISKMTPPSGQHSQAHDFSRDHYDPRGEASQFAAEPLPYDEAEPNWTWRRAAWPAGAGLERRSHGHAGRSCRSGGRRKDCARHVRGHRGRRRRASPARWQCAARRAGMRS